MGAESASVLKHIESIFERAVHEQVKPLEELISAAQQMIRAQYDHLARIKAEAQALMAAGKRANQLSTIISNELTEMRSRHAELDHRHHPRLARHAAQEQQFAAAAAAGGERASDQRRGLVSHSRPVAQRRCARWRKPGSGRRASKSVRARSGIGVPTSKATWGSGRETKGKTCSCSRRVTWRQNEIGNISRSTCK